MSPSCFVATIDLSLAKKLEEDLISQGFTLSTPAYTLFSAQKKGISCCLYTSGKLTVQGKDKDEFIRYYLEPEILHNLTYSYPQTLAQDVGPHIGIDESGKGDFFGALCVAGVYATKEQIAELITIGVKDSKDLSDETILKLEGKIKALCAHHVIVILPEKYNELYASFHNLNSLLGWGHATAISELVTKTHCQDVTIDQFADEKVVLNALKRKSLSVNLTQRHKAESDPVVAAASILARAAFVSTLKRLGDKLGITLPKGASAQVKKVGRQLIAEHGREVLSSVAKLHFKTAAEL